MPIKNYTTEIAVKRSVAQIYDALVFAGADAVRVAYNPNKEPVALSFEIKGQEYSLPCRAEAVQARLTMTTDRAAYKTPEHAQRVAWRILCDWVEVQLALIEVGMVELDEIMFPFLLSDPRAPGPRQTVWKLYREERATRLLEANN